MTIHTPTPSLLPHICVCGQRDSDPTWHRTPVATVKPQREPEPHYSPENRAFTFKPELPPEPVAVARRTDPSTSWEAARSVTGIRESQRAVLDAFRANGPMTDPEAFTWYHYPGRSDWWPPQSVSGFRTRRAELVARGLLKDSGERRVGSTGRRMIVWAAT